MEIINGLVPLDNSISTKIAIGKFDGVHKGHQKLLRTMIDHDDALKSVVFTFSLDSTFSLNENRLYSDDERRKIFESMGVDYLVEYRLDEKTASMSPEDFLKKILCDNLHLKTLYCGPDLSFGKGGAGNVKTVMDKQDELGITLEVIQKEQYLGEDISTTRIKKALEGKDEESARNMLAKDMLHIV